MRLAEKTIELNFCSQASARLRRPVIWFGLTQKQEARMGFDAITRHRGRLLLFQFKASDTVLQTGERRFSAPDRQLRRLMSVAQHARRRSAFYVLPSIGGSADFGRVGGDLIRNTWLLDVTDIPALPLPSRRDGGPRRNGVHYFYLDPPRVVIRSDPIDPPVVSAADFFRQHAPGSDGLDPQRVRAWVEGEGEDEDPLGVSASRRGVVALFLPFR
jgi:hypothetical protein